MSVVVAGWSCSEEPELVHPSQLRFPPLTRPVIDEAGFISHQDVVRIEGLLREMDRQGKAQMAVYVPRSLHGFDIESVGIHLAEAWKVGQKGTDRGLILILAPAERQMRLEVGYGLEGEIPDARARTLLDQTLRPTLRGGRAGEGVLALTTEVANLLGVDTRTLPSNAAKSSGYSFRLGGYGVDVPRPYLLLFLLLINLFWIVPGGLVGVLGGVLIGYICFLETGSVLGAALLGLFLALLKAFNSRRHWGRITLFGRSWGGGGGLGGGGSSSGGYSGGGGGFGGGGASSRW